MSKLEKLERRTRDSVVSMRGRLTIKSAPSVGRTGRVGMRGLTEGVKAGEETLAKRMRSCLVETCPEARGASNSSTSEIEAVQSLNTQVDGATRDICKCVTVGGFSVTRSDMTIDPEVIQ